MSDTRGFIERANLLLNQGRPADAETWIRKVLETEPENDEALSLLARSYMDRKDFEKGITLIQKAIALAPEESYYFYLLAFAHYQQNNHTVSLRHIQDAIRINPYHAEYYGLEAYIHIEEKDFKKALAKADEGLAVDAESIICLNARSSALNKLSMTDEAIATMQDALKKDPDNEFTHATIGWNFLEKGKHRDATRHFREALRLAPDYRSAKAGLKEALKSKIAPYRWLLQFNFWLQNKGKNFRWIFLIGLFVGVRIITSLSRQNKELEDIGLIVAGAYFLFVATSWIINPLANAFLLFHRDGKYALDQGEKWNAIGFMVCVAAGIGLMAGSPLISNGQPGNQYLTAGLIVLSLCIPVGHMQFPLRLKGNAVSQWIAMGLVLLALVSLVATIAAFPSADIIYIAYLLAFVAYTWTSAL